MDARDTHRRILAAVLTYNEGDRLMQLAARFPRERRYDVLFVDDGSTDGSADYLVKAGFPVIRHGENRGVGAGIRSAVRYCREHGYDVLVIMAGNGKMQPEEIPRLIDPILSGRADYVQGSRYLLGGDSPNLPLGRHLGIKAFTLATSLLLGKRHSDITCGFRAYRLAVVDDPEINIEQDWLGRYEMEYYLHWKAVKRGWRVVEAPVSMVYPESGRDYSKIRPLVGWWSMIRPWIYLTLRLKR
ncbi:MAG TPA: glycosyltransferase family 2 protein [candidate division Zixibacteria bacterium]|nr:glycosyltransferase family 2 protein [candidate division Zixibacteria bacterium]MDD4918599.1 glycosyltransferase family 2 protein [candidate division Zixibacteria bacterium]MDM7974318.1 glycosyltransferase family 2 protein [candidate division Zixibacteria bacterium]HPM37058.1 glycosyltransferase family 2 protein [candidate division Zixibacteria bacterium]HQL25171.1 glycosyltransferase family 2 protein [candidate division Zixibacteria bacterium]